MLPEPISSLRFTRLLLTGAAGNLGRELRPRLKRYCDALRLSDVEPLGEAGPGEEVSVADLADKAAVEAAVAGVDAVVHLGGISTEMSWEPILAANIVGAYNLYEAVRKHRVRRVVFASSNHVTGFYRQDEVVTPREPVRPDGLYGLSKAFGENIAQFYWDRHGVETVSLRIGSSYAEPRDRRMLATWMSFDDLERLVVAGLTAPVVGHTVIYGVSDNNAGWWDNRHASHIGYRPQDSSEPFRAALEARQSVLDPADPATFRQGGAFVTQGPPGSPAPASSSNPNRRQP
ncbi:MAG: NAD(P)-dependent oxidoreductase [Pseudomonadota bacterium]|nr:NAD(P)-dependent oxidoreductase [Pseudomonadota bacterium]